MNGEMVRLKGVVIPAEGDAKGNVMGTAMSAWDEIEYHIENDHRGVKLLEHMHEEIEVDGKVQERRNVKTIKVCKFVIKKRPRQEEIH